MPASPICLPCYTLLPGREIVLLSQEEHLHCIVHTGGLIHDTFSCCDMPFTFYLGHDVPIYLIDGIWGKVWQTSPLLSLSPRKGEEDDLFSLLHCVK